MPVFKRLDDDGVPMRALKPVLGWWYLQMLAVNAERRERVTAALVTPGFDPDEVRTTCCRLFAELHLTERAAGQSGTEYRGQPPPRPHFRGSSFLKGSAAPAAAGGVEPPPTRRQLWRRRLGRVATVVTEPLRLAPPPESPEARR